MEDIERGYMWWCYRPVNKVPSMRLKGAEMGQPMCSAGLRWLKLIKYQSVLIARASLGGDNSFSRGHGGTCDMRGRETGRADVMP